MTWTRASFLAIVATVAVSGFLIGLRSTSLLQLPSLGPSLRPKDPLGPLSSLVFEADRAYRRIAPDDLRSYRSDLVNFVHERLPKPEASQTVNRLQQFLGGAADCRHLWCTLPSWGGPRTLPTIPATIFQTSPHASNSFRNLRTESWRTQNPGWDYNFFDDRAIDETLGRVDAPWGELLDGLTKEIGVMNADVWRYLILMLQGEQEFDK
jgi:hypothetical protein